MDQLSNEIESNLDAAYFWRGENGRISAPVSVNVEIADARFDKRGLVNARELCIDREEIQAIRAAQVRTTGHAAAVLASGPLGEIR